MTSVNSCEEEEEEEEEEKEADDHCHDQNDHCHDKDDHHHHHHQSLVMNGSLSDVMYTGDGEAFDSVYSVASCSVPTSYIDDENLLRTIFDTCDVDKKGLVNISSLINYIRHTFADDDEQAKNNLDELWLMFEPNGCDVEVDHSTYESVMMEWIEKLGGGRGTRSTTPEGSPPPRHTSSRDLIAFSPSSSPRLSPSRDAMNGGTSSSPSRMSERRLFSLSCSFGSVEGRVGDHSICDEVEMADEIKQLRHKLRNAVEQKEKSDRSLAAAEEFYVQLINERDELQKKMISLQSVSEKSRSLENELEEVRESLANCEAERLSAEQRSATLLKENQLLESRVKELDEDLMTAYSKIEHLNVVLEETNQECEQRKANLENYTEALDLAKDSLERQKDMILKLEETLYESQFTVQILRNEKNDLEKQLSTTNDFGSYLSLSKRRIVVDADDKTTQDAGVTSESKRRKFNHPIAMPSIHAELEHMNIGKPSPFCEKPVLQRSVSDLTERMFSRRRHQIFRESKRNDSPMFCDEFRSPAKRKRRLTVSCRPRNVDGDEGVSSRDEDEGGSSSSDDVSCNYRRSRSSCVQSRLKSHSEEFLKQVSGAKFKAENVFRLCVLLQTLPWNDQEESDVTTQLPEQVTTDNVISDVRVATQATSTNAASPNRHEMDISNNRSLDSDVESNNSHDEALRHQITSSGDLVKERWTSELEALRLLLVKSQDILTILTQENSSNNETDLRPDSIDAVRMSRNDSKTSPMKMNSYLLTEHRSTGLTTGHLSHIKTQSLDHDHCQSEMPRRYRHTVSCPILPNNISRITKHTEGTQTEQFIGGVGGQDVVVSRPMSRHDDFVVVTRHRSNSYLRAVSKETICDTDQYDDDDIETVGLNKERTLFILPEENHAKIPMKRNCPRSLFYSRRPPPPPYVPPPTPFSRSSVTSSRSQSVPHLSRYVGPSDPPSFPLTPVVFVWSDTDSSLSTKRSKTLVRMKSGIDEDQDAAVAAAAAAANGFRLNQTLKEEVEEVEASSSSRTTSHSEELVGTSFKEEEEDVPVTEKHKDSNKDDVEVVHLGRRGSIRKQLAFSGPSIIQQDSELQDVEEDAVLCKVDRRSKLAAMNTRSTSGANLMPDHETSETESGKGSAGGSVESEPDGGTVTFSSSSSVVTVTPNQTVPTVGSLSESFPNLTDTLLRTLNLHRVSEAVNLDQMSELEIENKFQTLALAVSADKFTIGRRLELHRRQRDLAEMNVEKELKSFSNNLNIVQQFSSDSDGIESVKKLQEQVDVLRSSSTRLLSRGEVYGAIQQEERVIRAVELMVAHVEIIKRKNDKLRNELNETKRVLSEGTSLRSNTGLTPKILNGEVVRRSSAGATMQSITTGHHDPIRLQRSSTKEEDEQSIISHNENVDENEQEIESVVDDLALLNDVEYEDGSLTNDLDDEDFEDDDENPELDLSPNRRRKFSLQDVAIWWQERCPMSDFVRHCVSGALIMVAICSLLITLLPSNNASESVGRWVSWEEIFKSNAEVRYQPNVAPPI